MKLAKLMVVGLLGAASVALGADREVEASIRAAYNYRAVLDDSVTVTVRNGVASLTGVVANENFKALAGETASGVAGVTQVDNRLTIQPAAAEGSDAWIKAALQTRFLLGRNVGAAGIKVMVDAGVVTLSGTAENLVELNLAGIYAKEVPGVKDVRNELKVPAGASTAPSGGIGQVDDASLSALVKFALRSHRSTSDLQPRVTTQGAHVTIEGEARSAPMKNFIGLLAETLRGVVDVTNNLTTTSG